MTINKKNIADTSASISNKYDGPAIDNSLKNNLKGTNSVKFHMDVPLGNYDVTVEFGNFS